MRVAGGRRASAAGARSRPTRFNARVRSRGIRAGAALVASLLVVVAAAASPAAAAPVDAARVVPQRSIRGVTIGMGSDQVRRIQRRRPDRSYTRLHPVLKRTLHWVYGRMTVVFDGTKAGRRVVTVTTTSRRDRTASGIRVGSTEAAVKRRVAGVVCRTDLGYRRCVLGIEKAGRIITDFLISTKGRVARISLSRVLG